MKYLYVIGSLFLSSIIHAQACDDIKIEPDCNNETEYSWNPSNKSTTNRLNRFYALKDIISSEYEKGNYEVATEYINEYLELANIYKENWNYGNAIHDSYRFLGLISYKQGDINQAAQYLVKSSESTGSPQLDSFGPELNLADLLLQAGKVEEVKLYLNGVQKFWKMDHGGIDTWLKQIDNGEKPQLSRFGKYRLSLAEKIFNWLCLLWPVIASLIIYFIYRGKLSAVKFIPASILTVYFVTFICSFGVYYFLVPIMGAVPESLLRLTLYAFTVLFSIIIPTIASFYLSKAKCLHVQPK